ncbi:MAG TPA: protein kinase [Candidatus Angelobacter sp.]
MDSERWRRVEELCHSALEREASQQAAYLDAACGADSGLRREVESLLAHQKQAAGFIETPALEVAAQSLAGEFELGDHDEPLLGRRLGAYQIVEKIGSGGMGEVYRAVRADDEYQTQVAIKLVRSGQDPDSVYSRFKNERQILAGLDHPNIARLLDGGTTGEGAPYVVMELIEGQRIDRYCDSNRLSTTDRLNLFRQVCAAVQYAHQRLIVHRDIKPGNILVTQEGVPKLLDFGIAKIVDPESPAAQKDATLTVLRVLTPGYASPEQVRGGAITTASDVYSLGVVLYELLAGCSLYRRAGNTPNEIARAVCESEPEKPSTAVRRTEVESKERGGQPIAPDQTSGVREASPEKLSKRLRGDLDNIILMALRKEPERRYASVEQFSEDLRRHLQHLPVIAGKDTLGYRTSKFVTRHKGGVAAAAAIVATLVTGMVVTLHEARVARQQADLAREQRLRAERRFNDVRKLSNSLFDVHDAIANLPGSVAARKMIVGMSLNYLDSLAGEAGGDASLQRELADAYSRIADIQGRPGTENLGDVSGAVASYRKAAQITEALWKANPQSDKDESALGVLYMRLGHALASTADHEGALRYDGMALAIATELMRKHPATPGLQTLLAIDYLNLGQHQNFSGDFKASLESYSKAEEIFSRLAASPETRRANTAQYNLAFTYFCAAATWNNVRNYSKALEAGQKSLELRKVILARKVTNVRAQLDLADSFLSVGDTFGKKGNLAEASANYRRAQAIADTAARNDSNDQRARQSLTDAYYGLGDTSLRRGKLAQALSYGHRAAKISGDLQAADPSNTDTAVQFGKASGLLGDAYQARSLSASQERPRSSVDLKEALASYQSALDTFSALHRRGALPYAQISEMDRLVREMRRCNAARQELKTSAVVRH